MLQKSLEDSDAHWQGRLAVKVFSKPVQAFSATFELQGRPSKGELVLISPLGTTLAHMLWTADSATLISGSKEEHFDSLEALVRATIGTDLPVTNLFEWLRGQAEETDGWSVDLSELPEGRIMARHVEDVKAELKIILDR
jgi:outer membrane lipoprotein LolB